jgi:thiamine biosynthesis lipoprotein
MNNKSASHHIWVMCCLAQMWWLAPCSASADGLPTFAGPAMGTTFRVTLARGIPGVEIGEVHRDVEGVLARLDTAISTWREDSDASRFNRAAAGEWVEVAADLVTVVEIARTVHADSQGAFDITFAPAGSGRPVGMQHVVSRRSPAALRKDVDGIALDLGGIGPGYAVDAIGSRLGELGSTGHLVELGGEVRAWGRRPDGTAWRVALGAGGRVIDLADGTAIATSSAKPGRSPIDPRTGRVVTDASTATARSSSCAVADAWAVAAVVLGIPPGPDGTIELPVRARP